ncbi:MAG TPA: hypothetical protein VEB18_03395 [Candidatus Paceibacterota bacterium]|nr:hypothetical protein [Candidatus Paceibacterota bacterium]
MKKLWFAVCSLFVLAACGSPPVQTAEEIAAEEAETVETDMNFAQQVVDELIYVRSSTANLCYAVSARFSRQSTYDYDENGRVRAYADIRAVVPCDSVPTLAN